MNYQLFCALSLLSMVSMHNVIAMEKENASDNLLARRDELITYLENYKSYTSYSPETKEKLSIFNAIVNKVKADQNSTKKGAYAVATDCSFSFDDFSSNMILSLAVVQRCSEDKKAIDGTLPMKKMDLGQNGIENYVLDYKDIDKLRGLARQMNGWTNVSEMLWGQNDIKKSLTTGLADLEVVRRNHGITVKGRPLDSLIKEVFNDSNN